MCIAQASSFVVGIETFLVRVQCLCRDQYNVLRRDSRAYEICAGAGTAAMVEGFFALLQLTTHGRHWSLDNGSLITFIVGTQLICSIAKLAAGGTCNSFDCRISWGYVHRYSV